MLLLNFVKVGVGSIQLGTLLIWDTGYFQAKLPSVLRIYRDTLTADMKNAIKTAVADLLPLLLAQPLESDLASGERLVDVDGRSKGA